MARKKPWWEDEREPTMTPVNCFIIDKLMKDSDVSTRQLAVKVKLSTSTVQKIRNGSQDVTRKENADRIAKALGVDRYRIRKTYSNKDIKEIYGDDDIPF